MSDELKPIPTKTPEDLAKEVKIPELEKPKPVEVPVKPSMPDVSTTVWQDLSLALRTTIKKIAIGEITIADIRVPDGKGIIVAAIVVAVILLLLKVLT